MARAVKLKQRFIGRKLLYSSNVNHGKNFGVANK